MLLWIWYGCGDNDYHDGISDGADNDFDGYSKTNWLVW
jgi:hypothetical protein